MITKENITVVIDTKVFYMIVNPIKTVYKVEDLLLSRDSINLQIYDTLDKEAETWGCKVTFAQIKEINPPKDIRELYEKKAKI